MKSFFEKFVKKFSSDNKTTFCRFREEQNLSFIDRFPVLIS